MTGSAMSLDEFRLAAEIHGGDLAAWPDAARRPAAALLAVSEDAQAALEEAAALDAALALFVEEDAAELPESLHARILGDAAAVSAEAATAATAVESGAGASVPVEAPAAAPPGAHGLGATLAGLADLFAGLLAAPRWAAPGAALASAALGLWIGWAAPDAMVDPVWGALGGAETAQAEADGMMTAELWPEDGIFDLAAVQ